MAVFSGKRLIPQSFAPKSRDGRAILYWLRLYQFPGNHIHGGTGIITTLQSLRQRDRLNSRLRTVTYAAVTSGGPTSGILSNQPGINAIGKPSMDYRTVVTNPAR